MLEREGYNVKEASDGELAIQAFRQKPADIVITDIIMPNKEGIETIMEIKRDFPNTKIIAISGGGQVNSVEYLDWAKKLGAQRTFTKPVERIELIEAVAELISD
jgi:YesN/AraC family two-component response regulator